MSAYKITSQRELRKAFFQYCDECPVQTCTFAERGKHKTRFNLDANMCFGDWKDGLHREGVISDSLNFRALLF